MSLCLFFFYEPLGKTYITFFVQPCMKAYSLSETQFYLYQQITLVPLCFLIFNTFYAIIYYLKIPLFEQYKVNPGELWPWEKDS